MKRRYRLRKNADFQRVRRQGQSSANRLIVLIILPNNLDHSRFGFAVSKRIGNAVKRNKVKRQMRESARLCQAEIQPGWDLLFIARVAIQNTTYNEIDQAVKQLLQNMKLMKHFD